MLPANFKEYGLRLTVALATAGVMFEGSAALAQISSDSTTNTQVHTDEGFTSILGGIKAGTNLFHSFEQFSVVNGAAANFEHDAEIANIFSRVTGGSISEIDGLIQTQGDASLFLLNPAGIVFGDNAQLDIGGSFLATTGDRLIFADGTEFDAVVPKSESLLTVSLPVGIQYGGEAGAIEVSASENSIDNDFDLSVYSDNTLALLGGEIAIRQHSLDVVSSKLEIAAVESGTIALQPEELGWQFDYAAVDRFGAIDFRDFASIQIDGGGRVNFQGEKIALAAASGILDFNQFSELKTKVNLTATEAIEIDGGLIVTQVGTIGSLTEEAITDAGGDIVLNAPQISLGNGAIVSAATLSDGDGGSIEIRASELKLFGNENSNPAIITTSTGGMGHGGSIVIDVERLQIEDGSQIQALTSGMGAGGTISVRATEAIELKGTGILRSEDIESNITETELASGFVASSGNESLSVEAQAELTGVGGSLIIDTPKLTIDDSAQISVGSYGAADAGDIEIHTSSLKLDRQGEIVANTASNEGGSISVWAERSLVLDRAGAISTTADSAGNGGNITLETANLALIDGNRIVADANQGRGGNIYIDARGLFIDPSSSITASSAVDQNNGTVEISTLDLNSRLATDYIEPSSLVAEDGITASCGIGIGLYSDRLRDVGRGGIPHNPFREIAKLEGLSDLGIKYEQIKPTNIAKVDRQTAVAMPPIIEANRLVFNSFGQAELVADVAATVKPMPCLSDAAD